MKSNIGTTDRIIRIVLGLALLSLFFILDGAARYFGIIGIIAIATGAVGICPLYSLLGLKTTPPETSSR